MPLENLLVVTPMVQNGVEDKVAIRNSRIFFNVKFIILRQFLVNGKSWVLKTSIVTKDLASAFLLFQNRQNMFWNIHKLKSPMKISLTWLDQIFAIFSYYHPLKKLGRTISGIRRGSEGPSSGIEEAFKIKHVLNQAPFAKNVPWRKMISVMLITPQKFGIVTPHQCEASDSQAVHSTMTQTLDPSSWPTYVGS